MESDIIVIITALLFSATFSAMEIAFISSNKLKMEIEKKQSRSFAFIANLFTRNPSQYITTILVGNNVALVIYSLSMSALFTRLFNFEGSTLLLETLVSTLIIIFIAEFIPKAAVRVNPNFYFRLFSYLAYFFYLLFYPIAKFTTFCSSWILRMLGLKVKGHLPVRHFDKIDLVHLVEEAAQDTDIFHENENDIKIFQNALDFSGMKIRDCMIHRVDIEAVDINSSVAQIHEKFIETKFSRLPVYDSSIDNIIGYVNTKILFKKPQSIASLVNEVIFVPETMEASKLLTSFIKKQSSMAIVIDEFGGTAGMVTLEDILEEIFGEIDDEYDTEDMIEKVVGEKEYVFSARLEVEDLNEKYQLSIPESDHYDTLGGYIIFRNDGFPEVGQELNFDSISIKILRMDSSKIELVRLKVK